MEGPGMSLFQGAASIHINNSAQDRLDEQEELEDQKRRDEELQHKLANAFDDFLDDDEASSVNSSGNYTMDPAQSNGVKQSRHGLPPTYIESLNHLKETQIGPESQKAYCETPKNHHTSLKNNQEEGLKLTYSPYGAGDGQNNYYNHEVRGHLNGINNFDARQEYMNNEKLKVMYEMRVKECQQLAMQIEKLDTEIDSLRARLGAAVNDRDKAELSLQEAHHLLASSKHKLLELEQQVSSLTEKLMESDQDKEQLKLELRSANMSLQDVQQRLHTMQVAHSHDTDALFREQQDRHREEIERIQTDLTKAKNRLQEKENEIKILEKRCMEKDREKEEILIEKGATVNRLATELEAAQSRLVSGETAKLKEKVSQLTSERNAAKEQVKELGSKLEVTAHELVLCRNKMAATHKEYENWHTTLNQILRESVPDNIFVGDPPSPGKLATLKEVLSRYKQQTHKLTALQEEISKRDKRLEQHRKQESELRSKLEEQKGIEMQLNSKVAMLQNKLELLGTNSDSELLESYKQQNEQLQTEIEELRSEMKNVELKYTELEMEYDKLKSEKGTRASIVQEANADLLRELEKYSGQLKETLKENGELKTLYLQACSSRESVSRELKDVQAKLQKEKELFRSQEKEYVEKLEKERQQTEKLNSELASSKEELVRANKRISELQNEFTEKQKEFTDKLNKFLEDEKTALRNELKTCTQCEKHLNYIQQLEEKLAKCQISLVSQESNEALMAELRKKAEFFQQYIMDRFNKIQSQRSVATNTEAVCTVTEPAKRTNIKDSKLASVEEAPNGYSPNGSISIEKLVSDCDEAVTNKNVLMMKEKAIRDQLAEKFTLEMKTLEMKCAKKIKEIEDQNVITINKLKDLLEKKVQEVELLKTFILEEKSKVTEILEAKENEISVLIREHNELQLENQKSKECIINLQLKAERYKERVNRLLSLEDVLQKERENFKLKTTAVEKECQKLRAVNDALQKERQESKQKYLAVDKDSQTLKAKIEILQKEKEELKRNSKMTEMQAKLTDLQQRYEVLNKEYQTLQEKYKNVKMTVYTYKDYMTKKDAHVNNEMNRIQDEYRKIFVKLQNQINYFVNCRVQEERSKGKQAQAQQYQQYDHTEQIKKLHQDFAKLSKHGAKEPQLPNNN